MRKKIHFSERKVLIALFLLGLLRFHALLSLRRVHLCFQCATHLKLHARACCNLDLFTGCRVAAGSGFSLRSLKRSEAGKLDGVLIG